MTRRKRIGMVLLLAGLALLVMAGVSWRTAAPRGNAMAVETVALEDSARAVHERIVQTSLRLQGFRASQASMPDSVKRFAGNKIMETNNYYNKTIRKLETQERDIKLKIAALRRKSDRHRADLRATVTPVAAAGLVALLAGGILVLIPARPVGA